MTFIRRCMGHPLLVASTGLVVALALAGCGGGSSGTAAAPGGKAAAPASVRVALSGPISTLDPAMPRTANDYVPGTLVMGSLYRYDARRKPQLDLLESATVSEDGLTVTHKLKPGLKYSDGTPVVAEDAVYALERLRKTPGAFLFERVKSAEAPDDQTIVWHMKEPYPDFPDTLSLQYLWLNPKVKVEADPEAYFQHPVSAGPFVVSEWTPGSTSMRLTANPQYWRKPKLREIEFLTVADLSSRALQLTQGTLGYVFDLPPSTKDSFPKEVAVGAHPIAGMYNVTFNLAKPGPLHDPKVRQAISLAIDRQGVSDKAFVGLAKPACAFLYSGLPESQCMLPRDGARDVAGARKLLAEAGYAKGFSFELQYWNRPGWGDASVLMAQNLAEVGIKVKVTPLDDAVASERLGSGDFQAQFAGNTGSPVVFLANELTPGTFWGDAARYDDPQVNKLIGQANREPDADKRKQLLLEIQQAAYEQMPHIPIADRTVLSGSRVPDDILQAVTPGEFLVAGTTAK
jgi:peptide/nickel transport system substrate-binding protein